MKPAVVLATHTMGLGVIRALGMQGVPIIAVYYDQLKDMGYVSKYVTQKIYAPHPERSEDAFLNMLIDCSSMYEGSLLIPVSDETLTLVSRHKELLDKYYIVACAAWDITKRLIDKKYTYALAEEIGVPAPKTIIPQTLEDVEQYGITIAYPCLVKPCQSHLFFNHFGRKMVRVWNLDQMLEIYRQAVNVGMEVMLQEIIEGDDASVVNYNSYFWDAQPLVEFTAQQIRKAPPEFGSPCVAVSKNIPEVFEPGRRFLKAVGFYGYSCTEFKKDARDGVYKLIEVNGRHNLSGLLALHCGINFPWLQYKHLIQNELPRESPYQAGLYWIDFTRDISYSMKWLTKKHFSLYQYLKPYLKPHIFAVIDLKDPKPFFKRITNLIIRAVKATHLLK